MGCDAQDGAATAQPDVSIHAPTWGATRSVFSLRDYISVSIHAPTWGATLYRLQRILLYYSFNPRTHMGCDRMRKE